MAMRRNKRPQISECTVVRGLVVKRGAAGQSDRAPDGRRRRPDSSPAWRITRLHQ
ncbi:MAG: hypothetical protein MUP76_11030 [Acidimicrobiia bacterium]|nr:hypothetical protein [Acidimicrobiia bacterium]